MENIKTKRALLLPCFLLVIMLANKLECHALALSGIRSEIRILIKDNDSSRRRYNDAQLLTFINDAQREISNATWIIHKSTSISLVSGTTYYSLPSDLIEIKRVTREYKGLDETTFDKQDSDNDDGSWETTGGTPSNYFQNESQPDKIGIYPFPNSATSTGTIRMIYVAQPVDLASDSDVPFNSHNRYAPYHDAIIFYVCMRIFLLEGEMDKSAMYSQLYESRINLMRALVGLKPNYLPGFSSDRGTK